MTFVSLFVKTEDHFESLVTLNTFYWIIIIGKQYKIPTDTTRFLIQEVGIAKFDCFAINLQEIWRGFSNSLYRLLLVSTLLKSLSSP